jgi:hypothetical protein
MFAAARARRRHRKAIRALARFSLALDAAEAYNTETLARIAALRTTAQSLLDATTTEGATR